MFKPKFQRVLCVAAAAFLASSVMLAQDVTATIQGSVLDPTGAAVPNAKVTVTNTDRKEVIRTLDTDASGNYSAPLLPIGHYSLKIEAQGFKTVTRTGIALNVNDNVKLNIKLDVGAVSETVEVQEQQAGVESGHSGEFHHDRRRAGARAFACHPQLRATGGVDARSDCRADRQLYIGVSSPAGTAATIPYSVNGSRNSANNWTVDGADNVDRGSNQTLMTFPSVDSIAEFKVERGLYTADTGRAGGAADQRGHTSGTSDFHGGCLRIYSATTPSPPTTGSTMRTE